MITNLQRLGVDTTGEKTMSLTYSDDVRKNYQSLFRLLRRLTINYTFEHNEFAQLLTRMSVWSSSLSLVGKYRIPSPFDSETIKKAIGFTDKMAEEQIVINQSTVVVLYNGSAFRGQHIWYGTFRRPLSLSGNSSIHQLLLVSKPAAILLNWSRQGSNNPDFNTLASYMINKLSQSYTQTYRPDLSRIFHTFYVDYLARYSVTLQEREYEAMKTGSVATAYRTKKNIPQYIEERMSSTSLLNLFDFVEFDETVDLELLAQFESDVSRLKASIPTLFNFKVASLRLRKLGKHSSVNKTTTGLYYPSFDNIVVELRDVSSFVHEWGHALDNKLGVLSGQNEFLKHIYSPTVNYIARHITDTRFQSYYSMPNEVFARAFEWYVSQIYTERSGILKSQADYQSRPEYKCFEGVASAVTHYFDTLRDENSRLV